MVSYLDDPERRFLHAHRIPCRVHGVDSQPRLAMEKSKDGAILARTFTAYANTLHSKLWRLFRILAQSGFFDMYLYDATDPFELVSRRQDVSISRITSALIRTQKTRSHAGMLHTRPSSLSVMRDKSDPGVRSFACDCSSNCTATVHSTREILDTHDG